MTQRPNTPDTRRNRIGCLVMAAILAFFVALYLFAGFSAEPGNSAAENIPTMPAR
jgi:hypothetical protein